ncbi:hypothetical protein GCM10009863_08370 [Streptomyces axinellae]|uniref:Uncharacterized protein n=1 Tax=Streptomyces axinellae TaxID=552788 RepID=A0ABP6C182_9ACTN
MACAEGAPPISPEATVAVSAAAPTRHQPPDLTASTPVAPGGTFRPPPPRAAPPNASSPLFVVVRPPASALCPHSARTAVRLLSVRCAAGFSARFAGPRPATARPFAFRVRAVTFPSARYAR